LKLREDPCMNEFGIRVNETMEKVEGRVLEPPSLEYKPGREIRVRDGQWRADKEPFQVAGHSINNWAIVDLGGCDRGSG
jgi:Argonaute linker 2 domain